MLIYDALEEGRKEIEFQISSYSEQSTLVTWSVDFSIKIQ